MNGFPLRIVRVDTKLICRKPSLRAEYTPSIAITTLRIQIKKMIAVQKLSRIALVAGKKVRLMTRVRKRESRN